MSINWRWQAINEWFPVVCGAFFSDSLLSISQLYIQLFFGSPNWNCPRIYISAFDNSAFFHAKIVLDSIPRYTHSWTIKFRQCECLVTVQKPAKVTYWQDSRAQLWNTFRVFTTGNRYTLLKFSFSYNISTEVWLVQSYFWRPVLTVRSETGLYSAHTRALNNYLLRFLGKGTFH